MSKGSDSTRKGRVSNDTLFHFGGTIFDRFLIFVLVGSIFLFILYPMIQLVFQSLLQKDGGYSFSTYSKVWDQYRGSLWNSIWVGVMTAAFSTVISLGTALLISTTRGWVRGLALALLLITMVSPPFVSSLAYIQLFGRRGLISFRLLGLAIDPYNAWGIILMQSISFAPLNALFLNGLLTKIDDNAIRSAQDLGATPGAILGDIVLPLIRPGILVSLLLGFVRSLADFGTPIIIGGRFNTIASEIYLQFTGYSDLGKASALNMLLLLPSVAAFFLYRHFMNRADLLTESGRPRQKQLSLPLCRAGIRGALAIAVSVLFFSMMILQYTSIFISGFLRNTKEGYVLTGQYLRELIRYDSTTIVRSVWYALIVAVVGTFFAMLFAYYMDRRRIRGHQLIDGLATLPYMLPGVSFGIAYILAFNSPPLQITGTAAIVLINMLFKQLPTTTRIFSAALTQIPAAAERAARDLGGGQFAVIRDIILPGLRPALLNSFVYNFSSSMTTAGAIIFLIDASRKVAVFTLFNAVYQGEYALASLMSTLIIVIVLIVEGLVFLVSRKGGLQRVS